jgi:hypothetical protein
MDICAMNPIHRSLQRSILLEICLATPAGNAATFKPAVVPAGKPVVPGSATITAPVVVVSVVTVTAAGI